MLSSEGFTSSPCRGLLNGVQKCTMRELSQNLLESPWWVLQVFWKGFRRSHPFLPQGAWSPLMNRCLLCRLCVQIQAWGLKVTNVICQLEMKCTGASVGICKEFLPVVESSRK